MKVVDRKIVIAENPQVIGKNMDKAHLELIHSGEHIMEYSFEISSKYCEEALSIVWKIPAIDIKGSWSSNLILDKRIRADWENPQLTSSISIDAPLLSIFGQHDQNIICFASSDSINNLEFEAGLREEDNFIYCSITFFTEKIKVHDLYKCKILINYAPQNFSKVIQETATWLTENSPLSKANIPEGAKVPLYSTWYSYHQGLEEEALLEECRISKSLGYKLIIIDDGWQTMDSKRGYDYTGDWRPERIPAMADFVSKVHDIGMQVMLWYSVPFCGIHSKAYQKFKGKFLTEDHHWAPVFDPRFPEVRNYLVGNYAQALIDWRIDGFKLDFIDDFKIYPESETQELNGRDTLSVTHAVQLLISEIKNALYTINKNVLIEFRQKYVGPALQHLGNMFRAFDCPNDSLMNRVRTTDVKLICGETAVHSDMITWHKEESTETAALQFSNILFSVPQISVKLTEISEDHKKMIAFFTNYWNINREILLEGDFTAYKALSNYPYLMAKNSEKQIIGIYDDIVVPIRIQSKKLDVINAKLSNEVFLSFDDTNDISYISYNCKGDFISKKKKIITQKIMEFDVPPNGILQITLNPVNNV